MKVNALVTIEFKESDSEVVCKICYFSERFLPFSEDGTNNTSVQCQPIREGLYREKV